MTTERKPSIEAVVEIPATKELFIAATFNGKEYKGYLEEKAIR